jgi:hypothetical protein
LQQVYGRDRFGMDAYKFDLPEGDYIVRLHFAEGWFDSAGRRVFDVQVNGETVLDGFDIYNEAGGAYRAIHRDFDIEVGRKDLIISFEPVQDNPSINGIEIFRK